MNHSSDFWDALAPHHSAIENNYLDLPSLRRIVHDIHQPVLVVGAGQGLIVEELQKNGLHVEGVDLSSEMIRYAQKRRGLNLVRADARAMPFGGGTYETIIYATGVVDFIADDAQIRMIVNEARRIVTQSGRIFIAFYRISDSLLDLMEKLAAFRMQTIFRNPEHADSLIDAAPEGQPYRNEHEIRNLFTRLAIPIRMIKASASCLIVQI